MIRLNKALQRPPKAAETFRSAAEMSDLRFILLSIALCMLLLLLLTYLYCRSFYYRSIIMLYHWIRRRKMEFTVLLLSLLSSLLIIPVILSTRKQKLLLPARIIDHRRFSAIKKRNGTLMTTTRLFILITIVNLLAIPYSPLITCPSFRDYYANSKALLPGLAIFEQRQHLPLKTVVWHDLRSEESYLRIYRLPPPGNGRSIQLNLSDMFSQDDEKNDLSEDLPPSTSNFRFMQWNACSFSRTKCCETAKFASDRSIDALFISEIGNSDSLPPWPAGFQLASYDNRGRGIAAFVQRGVQYSKIALPEELDDFSDDFLH